MFANPLKIPPTPLETAFPALSKSVGAFVVVVVVVVGVVEVVLVVDAVVGLVVAVLFLATIGGLHSHSVTSCLQ